MSDSQFACSIGAIPRKRPDIPIGQSSLAAGGLAGSVAGVESLAVAVTEIMAIAMSVLAILASVRIAVASQ
jgi:hypothetical protein